MQKKSKDIYQISQPFLRKASKFPQNNPKRPNFAEPGRNSGKKRNRIMEFETGRQRTIAPNLPAKGLFGKPSPKNQPRSSSNSRPANPETMREHRVKGRLPLIGEKADHSGANRPKPTSQDKPKAWDLKQIFMKLMKEDSNETREIIQMANQMTGGRGSTRQGSEHRSKPQIRSKHVLGKSNDLERSSQKGHRAYSSKSNIIQEMLNKANLGLQSKPVKGEVKSMRGEVSPVQQRKAHPIFDKRRQRANESNYFNFKQMTPGDLNPFKPRLGKKMQIQSQRNFRSNQDKLSGEASMPKKLVKSRTLVDTHAKQDVWNQRERGAPKGGAWSRMGNRNSALSFQDVREGSSWSIQDGEKEDNLMESETESMFSKRNRMRITDISRIAQASESSLNMFKWDNAGQSQKMRTARKNQKSDDFFKIKRNVAQSIQTNQVEDSQSQPNHEMMKIYNQNKEEIDMLKQIVMELRESKKKEEEGREREERRRELDQMREELGRCRHQVRELEQREQALQREKEAQAKEIVELRMRVAQLEREKKHLREMSSFFKEMSFEGSRDEYQLKRPYNIKNLRSQIKLELSKRGSETGSMRPSQGEGNSVESEWRSMLDEKKKNIERIRKKRSKLGKAGEKQDFSLNLSKMKKQNWNNNLSMEINFKNKNDETFNIYRKDKPEVLRRADAQGSQQQTSRSRGDKKKKEMIYRLKKDNSEYRTSRNNSSEHVVESRFSVQDPKRVSNDMRESVRRRSKGQSQRGKKLIFYKLKGKMEQYNDPKFHKTQPALTRVRKSRKKIAERQFASNLNNRGPKEYISIYSNQAQASSLRQIPTNQLKTSKLWEKGREHARGQLKSKQSLKQIKLAHAAKPKGSLTRPEKSGKKKQFFATLKNKTKPLRSALFPEGSSPYQFGLDKKMMDTGTFNPLNYIPLNQNTISDKHIHKKQRILQNKPRKSRKIKAKKIKKVFIPESLLESVSNQNNQNFFYKENRPKKVNHKKQAKRKHVSLNKGDTKSNGNSLMRGSHKVIETRTPKPVDLKTRKKTSLFYKPKIQNPGKRLSQLTSS